MLLTNWINSLVQSFLLDIRLLSLDRETNNFQIVDYRDCMYRREFQVLAFVRFFLKISAYHVNIGHRSTLIYQMTRQI